MKRIFIKMTALLLAVLMGCSAMDGAAFAASDAVKRAVETAQAEQAAMQKQEETLPEILEEDETKREADIKHFKLKDGTMLAAQYEEPVHYLEDGAWKAIDNRLLDNGSGGISNQENDFRVSFPKQAGNGPLMELHYGGDTIAWTLMRSAAHSRGLVSAEVQNGREAQARSADAASVSQKAVVQKTKSKVVYRNILPQVDLEYEVHPTGVKENIIVKRRADSYRYTFDIACSGLRLTLKEDGSITAADGEREVFTLPAPFLYDAAHNVSNDVRYELEEKEDGSGWLLTIAADAAWMNDKAREFPVTIDPILSTEQKRSNLESGFVSSGKPNDTYTWAQMLEVGYDSSGTGQKRSFINVRLPELKKSDMVVSAYLNMYLYYRDFYTNYGDMIIDLYQVNGNWSEQSVTWNNQPAVRDQLMDYCVVAYGKNDNTNQETKHFEVTKSVKQWYEEPATQHGFLLRAREEFPSTVRSSKVWFASEHFGTADSGAYPTLQIQYRNNNGLESYWSYHEQDVGRAGMGYVNDYTGNLVFIHDDASMPGSRMPTSITHVYNGYQSGQQFKHDPQNFGSTDPNADLEVRVGYGWKLNVHQTVCDVWSQQLQNAKYRYIYTDADGTEHYFYETSDGKLVDEDGLGYELTVDSNRYKTITTKDKTQIFFDHHGAPLRIRDQQGNEVTYQYTILKGRWIISGMSDNAGRTITFEFDPNTFVLTGILDTAGRRTSYGYTGNLLTSITYPDGTQTRFAYNADNMLTSVTDASGYSVTYGYTNNQGKRVSSITEKGNNVEGQTMRIAYGNDNTTTFTASGQDDTIGTGDDINTTYTFNHGGQTQNTSTEKADGTALYGGSNYEYTATSGQTGAPKSNNKIKTSAEVGQAVVNLLRNPSFTSDFSNYTFGSLGDGGGSSYAIEGSGYQSPKSVKLTKTRAEADTAYIRQAFSLTPGKTYTASAYVRTENLSAPKDSGGVRLNASYVDGSGKQIDHYSRFLRESTGSEWTRLYATFTVADGAQSSGLLSFELCKGSSGTAWIDCIQIEEGQTPSKFNLIENAGFERYNENIFENWSTIEPASSQVGHSWGKVGHAAFIYGASGSRQAYAQYIPLTAEKKDTYVISGWAKADALPRERSDRFGFTVCIDYDDGHSLYKDAYFNPDCSGWQYGSKAFNLDDGTSVNRKPVGLTVYLLYQWQANIAWFDNVQLVRDDVPSYDYDNNGDLISVTDKERNAQFNSTEGNLTKMVDTKGNYTYYNYRHDGLLLGARTRSGVQFSFGYDGYGNPTWAVVEGNPTVSSVTDGGAYFIRNKRTGLFIDALGGAGATSEGTEIGQYHAQHDWNQRWCVHNAGSGQFYLSPSSLSTSRLHVRDNASSVGSHISVTASTQTAAFAFEYHQDDGSFHIKNVSSGKYLGLERDSSDVGLLIVLKDYDYASPSQRWFLEPAEPTGDKMTSAASYTANGTLMDTLTDNRGVVSKYTYDTGKGVLQNVVENYGGANARTTSYTYNANNDNLTAVTRNSVTNQFGYTNNRLTSITHNGFSYGFAYDAFGNTTRTSVGNQTLLTNTYAAHNGKLQRAVYGNGDEVHYEYDALDRVTRQTDQLGFGYSWLYNNQGQIARIYDETQPFLETYDFEYDSLGRVVRTDNTLGQSARYEYDLNNNLTMAKYGLPGGTRTTRYGFGLEDRLASTLLSNGTEVKLTYDSLSRVTKRSIGTGYHTTYTYTPAGDGKTTALLQSIQNGSQTFGYTYDAFGNITAITENGVVKVTYEYDSLNQLTRENNKYLNRTITYNYDAGGNITTKSIWMYTEGNPRAQEDQIAYDYTDANWKDKLTSYKGQAITYDAIGNPLQYRDGMQFSWINGRQLASATSSNGMERYAYNENGVRTAKNFFDKENRYIGRMQFYLDGNTIVAQEYEGETIWFHYDGEGMLAGFDIDGTYYYYLRDGQNNIVGILDSNCNQVVSYQYDSWGKLLSITGSMADTIGVKNPFRYRGYYYDTDTGLYYLQSRYYDPEIGRFINADTVLAANTDLTSYNLFVYCANNPINNCDPTGYGWIRDQYNRFKNWWNRTPSSPSSVSNAASRLAMGGEITAPISDSALGTTGYILSKRTHVPAVYVSSRKTVALTPKGSMPVPKYTQTVKSINKVSAVVTGILTTVEVADTWTSNNSNTNGKRVIKTGVQLGGVAAGVGVGYLAMAAANCWNPVGWGMSVAGVITYLGVTVAGNVLINQAENAFYKKAGIE